MAYEIKQIRLENPRKVVYAIVDALGISERASKRLVDKSRVKCNGILVERKGDIVEGILEVLFYEPTPLIDVNVVFEHEDFAIFDKPPFMLVHPNGFNTKTSLLDNIKKLYGLSANIVHRLDYETSGLVIASKNKKSEAILKTMFENRQVKKQYYALLQGTLDKTVEVKTFIEKQNINGEIKIKQNCANEGKEAISIFEPIEIFDKLNATLVNITPLTGRLHQIRLHSAHIGMPIFGEPIYGNTTCTASNYLDKKLSEIDRIQQTKASRVCLQAHRLDFEYLGKHIVAHSKLDAKSDFLNAVKGI